MLLYHRCIHAATGRVCLSEIDSDRGEPLLVGGRPHFIPAKPAGREAVPRGAGGYDYRHQCRVQRESAPGQPGVAPTHTHPLEPWLETTHGRYGPL